MKSTSHPESIQRVFAENPSVEALRIDAAKQDLQVGFRESLPCAETIAKVGDHLARSLPDPADAVHSEFAVHPPVSQQEKESFHHHHLPGGTIEFHRGHGEPVSPIAWKHFPVPTWQNRPPPAAADPDFRKMLVLSSVCGIAALGGHFSGRTSSPAIWAILAFLISYIAGSWYTLQEVARGLRHGKIDVHFLMLVVALGAGFVNAWGEGATLLFLFSLSGGLEEFAHHRTRKTIESLLKAAPKQALRRSAGGWETVPIEAIQPGDDLQIKPGELFPVDGTLLEGETSADESTLTGESIPQTKRVGDCVSGGTLNLEGSAVIRVVRRPKDSAIQRIISLIETAQQQKAPTQRFTDSFSRYYTWVILFLSLASFLILLSWGHAVTEAFYRTMILLVVASPCALVLSIPSAILVAIAAGARQGILFRGGAAVEQLAEVNRFAFDKTGTLTKGKLRVARIISTNGLPESKILGLAASICQHSTHPLSRAIVSEAGKRGLPVEPVEHFQNHTGLGMEAKRGAQAIFAGSRKWLSSHGITIPSVKYDTPSAEVWVAAGHTLGLIQLSDELRPEATGVIAELKHVGADITLLTGDRSAVANEVAKSLGIHDVQADLSPEEKLVCVHRWQAQGQKVAMIGDGINDAPALTAANVAIGMGLRGSDAALEQADVVLMHDKIQNLIRAVNLSRKARTIIRQNLVVSLGMVAVLIASALLNKISLSIGVVGHEGSTVLVVLNGLRLLHLTPDPPRP